jgi:arylsulfatase A-like enzyme
MKLIGSFLTLLLASSPGFFAVAADKPNIVFIITDDQAADAVAAGKLWGAEKSGLRTPNLDQLYQNGTVFRQAYNMGAWHGAVCVASRSMLLTGQFVWETKKEEQGKFAKRVAEGKTWSQRMKSAGYETYMSGKWHVETDVKKIFDYTEHIRPGMCKTVPESYSRPIEGKPDAWSSSDPKNGGLWEGGKHWSEVLADDAETFVKQAAGEKKPFFLYLAFNAPHDPRQAPQSWLDQYPVDKVPVPENFLPINPHRAIMGLEGAGGSNVMRDEKLAPFPRTEFAVRTHRKEYYAMVSHTDEQVGRIMKALEVAGVRENTIVIFTSDHGLAIGRHGLMGKQNMFEHSLRVPFVISGPQVPKGKVIDERIYLQDAVATALDMAGADGSDIDFKSLRPLMQGEKDKHYEAIYGAFEAQSQRTVIDGTYKLILYPKGKVAMLFDLSRDPLEKEPIGDSAAAEATKKRLFAKLLRMQKEMGDPLDLATFYPQWKK